MTWCSWGGITWGFCPTSEAATPPKAAWINEFRGVCMRGEILNSRTPRKRSSHKGLSGVRERPALAGSGIAAPRAPRAMGTPCEHTQPKRIEVYT